MTHHHLWTPGWYTSAEKRRGASCARCKLMARQVEREVKIIAVGMEPLITKHLIYETRMPEGDWLASWRMPQCLP